MEQCDLCFDLFMTLIICTHTQAFKEESLVVGLDFRQFIHSECPRFISSIIVTQVSNHCKFAVCLTVIVHE